jgi:hypothetical protein
MNDVYPPIPTHKLITSFVGILVFLNIIGLLFRYFGINPM